MHVFVRIVFAALFFFALPYGAYRAAAFFVDRHFRTALVPYPSEAFAALAGIAACCAMLGISFFIYGFAPKRRNNP